MGNATMGCILLNWHQAMVGPITMYQLLHKATKEMNPHRTCVEAVNSKTVIANSWANGKVQYFVGSVFLGGKGF